MTKNLGKKLFSYQGSLDGKNWVEYAAQYKKAFTQSILFSSSLFKYKRIVRNK